MIDRIDVGIAVDTEDGLIVPVLRMWGAGRSRTARGPEYRLRADAAARIVPRKSSGARPSHSRISVCSADASPISIIVPPQVAIVGAGRAGDRVVAHRGQPAVRRALPLTVIFDHRVVTGGEGTRAFSPR